MDIPALSMMMSQSELGTEVGTRVMAMSLDEAKVEGAQMQKALEMSVNPNVGANIDISL